MMINDDLKRSIIVTTDDGLYQVVLNLEGTELDGKFIIEAY